MKISNDNRDKPTALLRAEWTAALALTVVAIALHIIHVKWAGGLWRDEANTLALATLPDLGQTWKNLPYDSFPILWFLVVRVVGAIAGPSNDIAIRVLGSCVGLAIIAAVWFYARTFKNAPLLSLAFVAFNPSIIESGDSARAYGFGIPLILVSAALVWRCLERATVPRVAALITFTIAAVQALYYNSVLTATICIAALSVCLLRRQWKPAAPIIGAGFLAALSMLPYMGIIRNVTSWNAVIRIPSYTFPFFLTKLNDTLSLAGHWVALAWLAAFVLAVVCSVLAVFRRRSTVSDTGREMVAFQVVALVASSLGIFLFLKRLSYSTAPWYYLTLIAVAGVTIDALFGVIAKSPTQRVARLAAALIIAGLSFLPARRAAKTMESNMDIAARAIAASEKPGDFIVVNYWFSAVNFARYHRNEVDWLAIPPLAERRWHRPDLLMNAMKATDQTEPVRPVIQRIEQALRSGNRVFVVGLVERPAPGDTPVTRQPFLEDLTRGRTGDYERQWSSMVGYFLSSHATSYREIRVYPPNVFNLHENTRLFVADGWRP
ncbi:MAG TPA: hypothetical protein VM099_14240 [Gemmatimonadaceae bacterium]|nr:hypothetical protein [Gemmatimonadaceae bacterium]